MTDDFRRPLIAGNWKMNGLGAAGLDLARAVAEGAGEAVLERVDLLVCPPATLLAGIARALDATCVAVGGQDCHETQNGAHTGDVSAAMLADAGAAYVILGHSERRQDHGETDDLVCEKLQAAHGAGLTAIVCIGETLAQREAGQTLNVLSTQIEGSLGAVRATAQNTVIAYEPVWAIGTGHTPTSQEVEATHLHMRTYLASLVGDEADAMRLLYGGSVKPDNAAEFMTLGNVDGALVGGASLKAEDFLGIARAAVG